jgi:hypothetical protein
MVRSNSIPAGDSSHQTLHHPTVLAKLILIEASSPFAIFALFAVKNHILIANEVRSCETAKSGNPGRL